MNRFRNQRRVLFGAFIIIIGALSLLDNLHVFDAREVLHFWPMAFVALGGLKIFQTRNPSGYLVGAALIAVGVVLTLQSMGIVAFRWRDWWPVLLIAGGIVVISRGIFGRRLTRDDRNLRTVVASESYVDAVAVMSGNKTKNDSQDFRGGEITAVMGGIELDLRQASIQADATIHVFAMWGGIVIRVPGDWSVVTNGVPLLGGIDDKTVPPASPAKRLVIEGYAIMGGVEIKN
jgi:predicted membrane protein